ncbi:MAG: hypothetical protein BJ554DRAFT_7588, partial [Olpidium bornovanus]
SQPLPAPRVLDGRKLAGASRVEERESARGSHGQKAKSRRLQEPDYLVDVFPAFSLRRSVKLEEAEFSAGSGGRLQAVQVSGKPEPDFGLNRAACVFCISTHARRPPHTAARRISRVVCVCLLEMKRRIPSFPTYKWPSVDSARTKLREKRGSFSRGLAALPSSLRVKHCLGIAAPSSFEEDGGLAGTRGRGDARVARQQQFAALQETNRRIVLERNAPAFVSNVRIGGPEAARRFSRDGGGAMVLGYLLLAGAAYVAYRTNPDPKSFRTFLENDPEKQQRSGGGGRKGKSFFSKLLAPLQKHSVPNYTVDNYALFSVATVCDSSGATFLGVFGTWWLLSSSSSSSSASSADSTDFASGGGAAAGEDRAALERQKAVGHKGRRDYRSAASAFYNAGKLFELASSEASSARPGSGEFEAHEAATAFEEASKCYNMCNEEGARGFHFPRLGVCSVRAKGGRVRRDRGEALPCGAEIRLPSRPPVRLARRALPQA